MSKGGRSKSSSRSSHSGSRSGSLSLSRSRSRSRSHSKKHKHSSRSRSKSHSPQLHNRERQYPRAYQNPNQNRDFRGQNRGYRRPFYFRQRGRGFYQRGQYNNNRGGYGNYRQNWQNYRPNYSPRRNRSRSRSPKRRSASPQSRSRSRNSCRSSSDRSERSSSSRSSSPHSKSPLARRKGLKSKKAAKEAKLPAQEQREADSKERKSIDTGDRSIKASEGSSGTAQVVSAALDASQTSSAAASALSPTRKSPLHSVVVKRSPALSVPTQKPSPHYSPPRPHAVQQSTGISSVLHRSASRQSSSPVRKTSPINSSSLKEDNRIGDISPPAATYIRRYLEEQKSKASGLERENGKERDPKAIELEKERIKEKSSASEMSGVKSEYYSMTNEMEKLYRSSQSPKRKKHTEEYEKCVAAAELYKDSRYDQEDADELEKSSSGLLAHERKLSQELVHCSKKEQGFKSIFQHIQSLQSQRTPSELFAQHIVTIVHYVKEHHFESSGMTLSERFSLYQRRAAEQEMAKHKKSPEIHRRIDISPSAFRKQPFRLDEKKKSRENSHKDEIFLKMK